MRSHRPSKQKDFWSFLNESHLRASLSSRLFCEPISPGSGAARNVLLSFFFSQPDELKLFVWILRALFPLQIIKTRRVWSMYADSRPKSETFVKQWRKKNRNRFPHYVVHVHSRGNHHNAVYLESSIGQGRRVLASSLSYIPSYSALLRSRLMVFYRFALIAVFYKNASFMGNVPSKYLDALSMQSFCGQGWCLIAECFNFTTSCPKRTDFAILPFKRAC